jgi:hypothetical protein
MACWKGRGDKKERVELEKDNSVGIEDDADTQSMFT